MGGKRGGRGSKAWSLLGGLSLYCVDETLQHSDGSCVDVLPRRQSFGEAVCIENGF